MASTAASSYVFALQQDKNDWRFRALEGRLWHSCVAMVYDAWPLFQLLFNRPVAYAEIFGMAGRHQQRWLHRKSCMALSSCGNSSFRSTIHT